MGVFATAAASAACGKVLLEGHSDFDVLVSVQCGTVATGITATAANVFSYSITESTAASAAGSAITNANLTLGASAAFTARGMVNCCLEVTSDCATTAGVTLNGITYRTTAAGATALTGAAKVARAINGYGTSEELPHYTAIGEYASHLTVLVTPSDDQATGLVGSCTAGSGIRVLMTNLQGVVHVPLGLLSTNTPKYIGITAAANTAATSIQSAFLMSYPSVRGGTPGLRTITT